jgi:arylsulfatase A-like enzyme
MTTFDEVLVKASGDFMDKAKRDGKPFFVWHNTTRMHVWTFLSEKYKAMQNSQTNYGLEEAGMAQLDDSVGALLKKIDDIGETNNTIVIFNRQRRRSVHLAGWRHDAIQEHQRHRR